MNGYYLIPKRFKSIRVGLILHGLSFKNRRFFWRHAKDLLKLNDKTNTCLIMLNINLGCIILSH